MKNPHILLSVSFLLFLYWNAAYSKEVKIGELTVDIPEDYPKPLIARYYTSAKLIVGSKERENGSQSYINVVETYINKYPAETKDKLLKLYPQESIAPFLAGKQDMYDDFKNLGLSSEKISGQTFVKVLWSGKQKKTGVMIRGMYLVAREGDTIYELNYVDNDDYFDLCKDEAMKIFKSATR